MYNKTCVKRQLSKRPQIGFQDHLSYHLMQVKSIAECSNGSILQYFQPSIKLPFVIKIFILSIFEWPFYTGFTVLYVRSEGSGENDHMRRLIRALAYRPPDMSA